MKTSVKKLTKLGSKKTSYLYENPNVGMLETFANPMSCHSNVIHIDCPEFTSLCPKTGQPDFAKIVIDYIPGQFCVESKSLKLYLFAFRQYGEFHESCVDKICRDLYHVMLPRWISVQGQFMPRGGISIWPVAEIGNK